MESDLLGYDPDKLLNAVKMVESSGGKNLVSKAGALGPYQFMPYMAERLGIDPMDEAQARGGAAELLRQEMKALKDPKLAIAAYNVGRPAVLRAIEKAGSRDWEDVKDHLPKETQDYVPKILGQLA